MKRFVFWTGTGGIIMASCRDCDHRMEFDNVTGGEIILDATNTHDCFRDEQLGGK